MKVKSICNLLLIAFSLAILNSSCQTPTAEKAFDIPKLVNKDMEQIKKDIGSPNFFTDEGNMRWATYHKNLKDDLAVLDIIYNPYTNQIDHINCSMQNDYSLKEFMTIANIDTLSMEYRVVLAIDGMINSKDHYYAISIYPVKPTIVYDVPRLVNKNIDELSQLLGKNLLLPTPEERVDKSIKERYATIERRGYKLSVAFNSKNKKVNYLSLQISENKGFKKGKDMLTIGNLDTVSKSYSCVLGRSTSLGNRFNSVSIYPSK